MRSSQFTRSHEQSVRQRYIMTSPSRTDMLLFTLTLLAVPGSGVSGNHLWMAVDGQVYVMDVRESLYLDCTFHVSIDVNYNLFDYPVLWRKAQDTEETQINIMSNINEPFLSTNRFEVTFTSVPAVIAPSQHSLPLSIKELGREDSGNYTCEVRGPQSVILGTVTHRVYVRDPVNSVVLSDDDIPMTVSTAVLTPGVIHVVENRPTTINCATFGGYPPPSLELYLNSRDVTSDFNYSNAVTLEGELGLRRLVYRTDRRTNTWRPRHEEDKTRLKCIATVAGIQPYITFVQIAVDYSPKLTCFAAEAYLGDRNVQIRCEVKAKPLATRVFWIIDSNGTTVTQKDAMSEFWILNKERDGIVETQLFIRQVRLDQFTKYTVVAENNIDLTKSEVRLSQRYKSSAPRKMTGETAASSSSIGHVRNRDVARDSTARRSQGASWATRNGAIKSHRTAFSSLTNYFIALVDCILLYYQAALIV